MLELVPDMAPARGLVLELVTRSRFENLHRPVQKNNEKYKILYIFRFVYLFIILLRIAYIGIHVYVYLSAINIDYIY